MRIAMMYSLLLAYIKFMKSRLSLVDFVQRVKERVMMQVDLIELHCVVDSASSKAS
jgi:hypothetical protein